MEQKKILLYRIWHWTMAFSVIGLLGTVLLRKTFLSYKTNAIVIQEKLQTMDIELSIESAKLIGKAIRAPMWEWHYIFALSLGVSIALYFFMLFTKKMQHPFIKLIQASKEDRLKFAIHLLLCFFICIMTISGVLIYFQDFLGISKAFAHDIKEFHEFMMNGLLVLIPLHLAGVIRHEITTKEPIISQMIHGD